MKQLYYNAKIYYQNRLQLGSVLIEDGKITAIETDTTKFCNFDKKIDLAGRYLIPGFIDSHIHGMGGYSFQNQSSTDVTQASQTLASYGVTSFVPTISRSSSQDSEIIDDSIMALIKKYSVSDEETRSDSDMDRFISDIKETMWKNVGIVRDESSLLTALSDINKIAAAFDMNKICSTAKEYEVRNLIYVAKCIINAALKRKTSIGAHYRSDSIESQEQKSTPEILKEQSDESTVTA